MSWLGLDSYFAFVLLPLVGFSLIVGILLLVNRHRHGGAL